MTVGDLRKALKNVPDKTEITIWDENKLGYPLLGTVYADESCGKTDFALFINMREDKDGNEN